MKTASESSSPAPVMESVGQPPKRLISARFLRGLMLFASVLGIALAIYAWSAYPKVLDTAISEMVVRGSDGKEHSRIYSLKVTVQAKSETAFLADDFAILPAGQAPIQAKSAHFLEAGMLSYGDQQDPVAKEARMTLWFDLPEGAAPQKSFRLKYRSYPAQSLAVSDRKIQSTFTSSH